MEISKDLLIEYSQCLVGEKFSSKKWGMGECVSVCEKSIDIDFGKEDGIKHIAFPDPILDGRVILQNKEGLLKQIETVKLYEGVDKIKELMSRRHIEYFVHFTAVSNLESIMRHGICSIDYMKEHNIEYAANDTQRLDGRTDAISLSVSFPNYKYFYRFQQRGEECWCVILLNPQKVVSLDCAYFWTNAASTVCRRLEWEDQCSRIAFDRMFDPKGRSRIIPDCYTTDPQAEVMVKGVIPADYIEGIVCDGSFGIDNKLPCKCFVDYTYFAPRMDYKEWPAYYKAIESGVNNG